MIDFIYTYTSAGSLAKQLALLVSIIYYCTFFTLKSQSFNFHRTSIMRKWFEISVERLHRKLFPPWEWDGNKERNSILLQFLQYSHHDVP